MEEFEAPENGVKQMENIDEKMILSKNLSQTILIKIRK